MKMKNRSKRFLSWLLVFVMVLSLMPTTVFATPKQNTQLTEGSSDTITIAQTGDSASYTFKPIKASGSNAYIMYCQFDADANIEFPTVKASGSNAILDPTYVDKHPARPFVGYVVDGNLGETYTMEFVSNGRNDYNVTVGVERPLDPSEFTEDYSFSGYYFKKNNNLYYCSLNEDRTIPVNYSEGTLELLFSIDNRYAYDADANWNASSSNASVVELTGSKPVAEIGSVDYGAQIGYAPVFSLNGIGTATITITAEYRGETISKDYYVTVSGGTGNVTNNEFKTMDDLCALIENGDTSSRRLHYAPDTNTPFVVSTDYEVPSYIDLTFHEYGLEIPAGVEFSVKGQLYCEDLNVAGVLNVKNWMNVGNSTTVSGTLNARNGFTAGSKLDIADDGQVIVSNSSIRINYPGTLNGIDHISFNDDGQNIIFDARFKSVSELKAQAAKLETDKAYEENSRVRYIMVANGSNSSNFVIDEDITIPKNVQLQLYNNGKYSIAAGKTLTVDGEFYLGSPLTVDGSLVNNGRTDVYYRPNRQNSNEKGTVTFGSNGSYSGSGEFYVFADSSAADISDVLKNFSFTDYDVSENIWNDGTKEWKLNYAAGLIKLGTPTELTWGMWYWEDRIRENGKDKYVLRQQPKNGFMSWKTAEPDQAHVEIKVYRQGESKPCLTSNWRYGANNHMTYRSNDDFLMADMESGTYYFTVQSVGDYKTYRNSDVATSGFYTYVKPDKKLNTLKDLKWVDKNDEYVTWADWADHADSEYLDGYRIRVYYSPTNDADSEFRQFSSRWGRGEQESEFEMFNEIFQTNGVGYYKFKVRALSGNIEEMGNSDWSEFSPVFDLTKIPQDVSKELDNIIDNVANDPSLNKAQVEREVKKAVQNMDKQELLTALVADKENNGATEKLAELESYVGGPAPVQVRQDAVAFAAEDISVVGASLNNKADANGNPIKLVIDKPEENHVVDELYNSAVAVKFSMSLKNVKNPKQLEVPVKITLPIPDSINPDFLVILHYHVNGSHEEIRPHVYEKAGKWYADFVLTSFSDFTMTEKLPRDNSGSEWESDDDSSTVKKTALPNYVVTGSWTNVDGKWMFADGTGESFKNRWAAVVNPYADAKKGQGAFDWFFFDATGHMLTGWFFDGNNWYYLNPVSDGTMGRMFTGWQLIGGTWYYLNPVSDGTRGAMKTDWQLINDKWYYFDPKAGATQGAMSKDAWIDGYYVNANGAWEPDKVK